jgi:spore coat polysaccharide biosynthesis predicted glycosyltransferase SpsG
MHVVVRVDGGATIGIGHAMRCATLVRALREDGAIVEVLSAELPDVARQAMLACGASFTLLTDIGHDVDALRAADAVVVDGYQLSDTVRALAGAVPLLVIDDNRELPVDGADLVLNQNLHATPELYFDVPPGRLLLGSRYTLLRHEVRELAGRCTGEHARTVLVSMGGADPLRLTLPLADELRRSFTVIVAISPTHPDRAAMQALADGDPLRVQLDRGDLVGSLAAADLAVVGGGTTLYEVAAVGVPTVAAVTAENQRDGTKAASDAGFVVGVDTDRDLLVPTVLGEVLQLQESRQRRERMSAAGRSMFDGRGAQRVAAAVATIIA